MKNKNFAEKVTVYVLTLTAAAIGLFLIYGNNKTAAPAYFVLSVCLVAGCAAAVLVTYGLRRRGWPIHRVYLPVALILGLVFLFVTPIYTVPDEESHFRTAYLYSDYEGVVNNTAPVYGLTSERSEDLVYSGYVTGADDYVAYLATFAPADEEARTTYEIILMSHAGSRLIYLLPSLGIRLALTLGLSFGWLSLFARLPNMLFFILMAAYAIYKLPYGKRTLFFIALLPITLQQTSSVSYDCPNLAASLVVTALGLHWCVDGFAIKGKKWYDSGLIELGLFILSCILMLQCKRGLYLLIALIPLILCIRRLPCFATRKRTAITLIALAAVLALYMAVAGYDLLMDFLTTEPYVDRYEAYGFSPITYFICSDYTIGTLKNTFSAYGRGWLYELFGGNLGWTSINVWGGFTKMEMAVFLFSLIQNGQDKTCGKSAKYAVTIGGRIVTLLLALTICFLSILAMLFYWTESGSIIIDGVQGRYFLPALPAFAVAVGYWKKPKLKIDTDTFVCTASAFLSLLVVMDVLAIM